jgi:hypothetical protein
MADFDVKQEAHAIVAMVESARMFYSSDVSAKFLEEAHGEFCKNTPENKQGISDLWTRAKHIKDGSGKEIGVKIKDMYLSFDCGDKQ